MHNVIVFNVEGFPESKLVQWLELAGLRTSKCRSYSTTGVLVFEDAYPSGVEFTREVAEKMELDVMARARSSGLVIPERRLYIALEAEVVGMRRRNDDHLGILDTIAALDFSDPGGRAVLHELYEARRIQDEADADAAAAAAKRPFIQRW